VRAVRIEPGEGQESVWDYPRPPAIVESPAHVRVLHRGVVLADTRRAKRVLETSQPPAYYLPADDVATELLVRTTRRTVCEWKGVATYWSIHLPDGTIVADAAWSYEEPVPAFEPIRGHLAIYAQKVDECWVDSERVQPNPGTFYGGWITSSIVGPFKGAPGTLDW
jgi:uncharacterized protein (DUF427 family)